LYISFKEESGDFSTPENLGDQINTSSEDSSASISEDGIYLFFTSSKNEDLGYNPYWIRIDEIEVFKQR